MTKFVVLFFVFLAPGSLVHAQGTEPADKTGASPSTVATEEEVSQLRSEVAAQRKTIEELKGMVQQLAEANCNPPRRFRPTLKGKPAVVSGLPSSEQGGGTREGSRGVANFWL